MAIEQRNDVNINIIDNNQGIEVINLDGEVSIIARSSTPIFKLTVQNNEPFLVRNLAAAEALGIKEIFSGESYYFDVQITFSTALTFSAMQTYTETFYYFDANNKQIANTVSYTLLATDINLNGSLNLAVFVPNLVKAINASANDDFNSYYEFKSIGSNIYVKILNRFEYVLSLNTGGTIDKTFFGAVGNYNLSKDNGASWNRVIFTQSNFYNFLFLDSKILASNASGIYQSLDNGITWTSVYSLPFSNIYNFINLGNNIILASSNGGIIRSTNNGVNFGFVTGSGATTGNSRNFLILGSKILVSTSIGISQSLDLGLTWTIVAGTGTINGVGFLNLGSKILFGTTSGIYQSIDNGVTWTLIVNTNSINGNGFLNLGTKILLGSAAGIYQSSDAGLTWGIIDGTATLNVNNFLNLGNKILAGTTNGIYQSLDSGLTWTSSSIIGINVYSFLNLGNKILSAGAQGVYYSQISWFYNRKDQILPFLAEEDYFIHSLYLKLKKYFLNNTTGQYIYLNIQWAATAITTCPPITLADLINLNRTANSNLSIIHVSSNINGETDTVTNLKLYDRSLQILVDLFETAEKAYLMIVLDSVLPLRASTEISTWNDTINFDLSTLNSKNIMFIATIDGSPNGDVARFLWNFLNPTLLNYCIGLTQAGEALANLVSNNVTKNIGDHSIATSRLDNDGINNLNPALIFNLDIEATLGQFTYIDNNTFDLNSLIERSIVCARPYSNRNGTFFQSDDTCIVATSNFRQFAWIRTVNKGAKIAYDAVQTRINAAIPYMLADGSLGYSGADFIKGIAKQAIAAGMYPQGLNDVNAELRAEPIITIDIKQKPLITRKLFLAISFPIVGTSYTITINITNQL